ncbi:SMP-30/gluconolactonase/LRE family protein [Arenicella xantha]|uniref:Sugar lactone lactonase YvrE n=1 Tax=Arenicella xantha TaxID=644221 RepID=A0A395JLF4_9GAMM|nr:SMP-30/gluconolactonase/LRE family protein [Arenicella xantha]RBP51623.1 sugar lactone lactonase YvrE [Arenicella xantha]
MITLIDTIKVNNELGEGVIWDALARVIWWTDIQGKTLYQYAPETKELNSWQTPERIACFAPVQNRTDLVVAFESGFAFYQPDSGAVEWIHKVEQDNSGTRFNDGRTDRQGRFWAGTMVENEELSTYKGSLYCLQSDLSIRQTISGLAIPNSLCWSPDSTLMYHTDTPSRTIRRYDFDSQTGTFDTDNSSAHKFVTTEPDCFPDGSIIDADGYLWNAQWGGSKVVRYAPDGSEDLSLAVPTAQPTCVAFAGTNLDLLVVTSAHEWMTPQQRAEDPQAGNVFIYQTPFKGLVESRFKLGN